MYCVKCGKELIPGAAFCTGCGCKIEQGGATPVAPKAEEPEVEKVEETVAVEEPIAQEKVEQVEATPVTSDESVPTPVYTQNTQGTGPVSKKNGITGMVLGCVGSFFLFFLYFGLVSLVCGIIGNVFSKKAFEEDGFTWGMAKAGKITSKVAIIAGAVELGLVFIIATIYGCAMCASVGVSALGAGTEIFDALENVSSLFIM